MLVQRSVSLPHRQLNSKQPRHLQFNLKPQLPQRIESHNLELLKSSLIPYDKVLTNAIVQNESFDLAVKVVRLHVESSLQKLSHFL